jgi:iron complex outermembrane receptor protein
MTTLFRPLHPRALPALLVLLLLACSWLTASAQATKRSFDIPAGRAEVTLKAFAEQAGAQFFFSAEKVGGVRTAPVKGEFAAREALDWMLKDSGLVAVQDEKTGALSVRRDDSPNAPRAAQTDRERPGDQGKVEDGKLVLDKFEVFGSKSINLDLPRTRDDAQPYVVFSRDQIASSQVSNIQDFFRTRLPMNTTVGLNTFTGGSAILQTVNLRGLGTNQTLVLVDGRRLPPLGTGTLNMLPPDINGIPLESIERIEVLPSTASGIYGGGATGGVINIITRKDYSGADLTLNYQNTFDTDTARRRADLNASTSLRGGATMITLTASWQDANDLLTQDRDFAVRARQLAFANNLAAFTGTSTPPRGYTTNIRNSTGANLVLKPQYGGTVLSSAFTSVPVGYAGIASDNAAALVANAGRYNLDLPDDLNSRRSNLITKTSPLSAFGLGLRQKITPWLEGYVDYQRNTNFMRTPASFSPVTATLAATAPNNPFTTAVNVAYPLTGSLENEKSFETVSSRVAGGLVAKLPREWQAGLDYVWGRNESNIHTAYSVRGDPDGPTGPSISYNTAISTGVLDVMRDLNVRPLDYSAYLVPGMVLDDQFKSTVKSLTVRASGPTFHLPTGPVMVSGSVDWQRNRNEPAVTSFVNTTAPTPSYFYVAPLSTTANSGYLEARVPLLASAGSESKQARLELQLAGRYDRSIVDTLVASSFPTLSSPTDPFPDLPRRSREFKATSYTAGLRYTPVPDIALRASVGTGFLAPDVSQLFGSDSRTTTASNIVDPKRGGVATTIGPFTSIRGGNPELKPEYSDSYSAGMILTPRVWPGFRFSIDYTKIDKTDEIANLANQQLLDYEEVLPGLVVRAPLTAADQVAGYTGGVITQLNTASVNVARRVVEAVDFQADYTRKTSLGEFHGYAVATWNRLFASQVVPLVPLLNQIGYLGSPQKWRGNAGLDWSRGPWSAGWNAQFYDAQFIYSFAARTAAASTVLTQGGSRFPSQVYHDLMVSYQFGRHPEGWRRMFSNVKLSVGLQNVFDREPPLAAGTGEIIGFQNIEDPRLRRYSLTLRKHF